MKKNTAGQVIGAQMVSAADGSAFTGSVTVAVTGDGGTQATGSVGSGACAHEGNGFHTYSPSQAETNYDHVAFTFTGTGAVPATVQVYPAFPQTGDSFARLGGPAGASIAADLADLPTVAEFEARTLPAASYFDPASDLVTVDDSTPIDANVVQSGGDAVERTAQAGTTTSITLAAAESDLNDSLNSWLVWTTGGTGANQLARITDYAGSTRVATVVDAIGGSALATAPASDTTYQLIPPAYALNGGGGLDAAGVRSAIGLASADLDAQLGAIDAAADAILADTGTDGVALSAAAVDAILDEAVEGSTTFRQLMRGFAAALLGKASGLGTTTATYRDLADSKARITATVDADGNRSAVTRDLS